MDRKTDKTGTNVFIDFQKCKTFPIYKNIALKNITQIKIPKYMSNKTTYQPLHAKKTPIYIYHAKKLIKKYRNQFCLDPQKTKP